MLEIGMAFHEIKTIFSKLKSRLKVWRPMTAFNQIRVEKT